MNLNGTPEQIIQEVRRLYPDVDGVLDTVRERVPFTKRAIAEYQAAALYALARPYNVSGMRILEIGTAIGYSAAILGEACPLAEIVTLNPRDDEAAEARENLRLYRNITVLEVYSEHYLYSKPGNFDFIFVDGDHKNVRKDFPYWDLLNPKGAMVFHDYSPAGTYRECPPVYRGVNDLTVQLGKSKPDILVVDDGGVGMAGFYKESAKQKTSKIDFALATAHAASTLSWQHIEGLYNVAKSVENLDGVIVECGVGGSAIAAWYGAGADKELWLFDTFSGVPQPDEQTDGGKCVNRWLTRQADGGWCVVNESQFREVLKRAKVPAKYIHIMAGDWRQDLTLLEPVALLHIDATLYDSTRKALELFYPKVLVGGIVTITAYGHWDGVRRAVDEYFSQFADEEFSRRWTSLDGVNIWMRK